MFENQLRVSLSQAKEGKDITREAGQGVFANFVRATCYPTMPSNVEEFDKVCKRLVETLNEEKELSKDEKNSLRSAKSVVGKAITNNVDVWQRESDTGQIVIEDGAPMPKGKSELQESKTDFQRMMGFIQAAQKKWESDNRDVFTTDELDELYTALISLSANVLAEKEAQ